MKKLLLAAGVIGIAVFAATSCAKKEEAVVAKPAVPEPPKVATVNVVKEQERSAYFLAVNKQLELGGTLYGYVDVDGDVLKMAGNITEVVKQMAAAGNLPVPQLKQDYGALATMLGLTDIKAAGFSSVPDGTGFFRNRTFIYIPGERRGLLAGLGGKPAPFTKLSLAPAGTDFYFESEMDVPSVYATIREVTAKISGQQAADSIDAQLKRTGEHAAFSLYNFIQGLKGRATVVVRFDPDKQMRVPAPQPVVLPAVSFVICLDGVAAAIEPALVKAAQGFKLTEEGKVKYYELTVPTPLEGIRPVFAVEGNAVYLATSRAFLQECRSGQGGLAQQPEFKQALAHVGETGNALCYVSPRFFDQLRRVESLNPQMPPESRQAVGMMMRWVPKMDRPLVTVRSNLPDGILFNSYWNRSLKQDVAMISVYNPVTVGFLAAMAIPAFQKVRQASQEKAVTNNLRQLAAASDQFYLESGKTTATYDDLVGTTKYVRQLNPVAGEDYHAVVFKKGAPLRVMVPSLRKFVSYPRSGD
jgi:type IV pilus assembly protein PilA